MTNHIVLSYSLIPYCIYTFDFTNAIQTHLLFVSTEAINTQSWLSLTTLKCALRDHVLRVLQSAQIT